MIIVFVMKYADQFIELIVYVDDIFFIKLDETNILEVRNNWTRNS